MISPPGFFGKLPARGDFLSRRIAPSLAPPWDAWLGQLATAVREAAGADWPEIWLTAPLWHFALGHDIAPHPGAAGVLMASADKVGRMFPFTIIGPAYGIPDAAWFAAVESLVLGSLDDDFGPDALDAALVALGGPTQGNPIAASQSLWRTGGSDLVAPSSLLIDGLPDPQTCRAMVLGDQNAPHSGAK